MEAYDILRAIIRMADHSTLTLTGGRSPSPITVEKEGDLVIVVILGSRHGFSGVDRWQDAAELIAQRQEPV